MSLDIEQSWSSKADDDRYAARLRQAEAHCENLANLLLGTTINRSGEDIPKEQLRWLKNFARARLSRPEYRVIATMYGWLGPAKRTAMIQAKASALLRAESAKEERGL